MNGGFHPPRFMINQTSRAVGGMAAQQQQEQQPRQPQVQQSQHQICTLLHQNNTDPHRLPDTHQCPPDPEATMVSVPAQHISNDIPAPLIVIPSEESVRHRASHEILLQHQKVGFEFMEYQTGLGEPDGAAA